MDFSILKSDEKIKPLSNYMNPSPNKNDDINKSQKSIPFSINEKDFKKENNINFKENATEQFINNNQGSSLGHRFSSYEPSKLIEKSEQIQSKSNENPLGEKGAKFNLEGVVFKAENEFIQQDSCKICENDMSDKKNCMMCGYTVCKFCSTRKINENRVCDLCFLKVKSTSSEIRKKDFLNVTLSRREDLKNNISQGKNQLSLILKEINVSNEKTSTQENFYSNTLTDLQIKSEQIKEKQNVLSKKFHETSKHYEKRKALLKSLQEKANAMEKINEAILNSVNTKKQIYLSKFDEFCKLQNHKEDLENSEVYKYYLKEQELLKNSKEKNKLVEQEEQKKQISNKSSFTNSLAQNNLVSNNQNSYDYRKPSILDEKNDELTTPQLNKTSVVKHSHLNGRKKSPDEVFCDNACTGAFFSYHKKKGD